MLRLTWLILISGVIMLTSLHYARNVSATEANSAFTATTIAKGRFGEIDVSPPNSKLKAHESNAWSSWQKTQGLSDLYVQSNVWKPGGSTGWHTHPGQSLIIVTEGMVTGYEGDDPDCKPHLYTQGMGFVDPGGGHVHILRNHEQIVAQPIAVQLYTADASHR